jgi:hypothetical protein
MADIALTAALIAPVFPDSDEIFPGIAGVAITAGQAVYIVSTTGKLGLADEDASAEASWVWGISLDAGAVGDAVRVLRRGHCYGFTVAGLAWALPVSLSATAGALLDTGATTNIVGRIVAMTDPDLTKVIFFDFTLAAQS